MSKATIEVTGVGRVFVETEAKSVELVGAVAADGSAVNRRAKTVSRAAKHEHAAQEADAAGYWLKPVGAGAFQLMQP